MERDIRQTPAYGEAEAFYRAVHQPSTGQISDAAEICVAPDGGHAVFAGIFLDKLEGAPQPRICQIDLRNGAVRVLTLGPNTDRLPKYSPDGRLVAFLSDRREAGNFQLHLLDPATGAARATPSVDGWVEYLHWSPDGRRVLLGVAGHGADVAGGQGAISSKRSPAHASAWMPTVETGDENYRWRTAWIYEVAANSVRQIDCTSSNVWEAVWCGNSALAAIVSPGPSEGLWYSAQLQMVAADAGEARVLHVPRYQLGWPAASPSGKQLAFVEATCSDRWIVCGDLRILETASGKVRSIDTQGVDISYTQWQSEQHLIVAGLRGLETVVGRYDLASDTFASLWGSEDISTAGHTIKISPFGEAGNCVLVADSYVRAPQIALIRQGRYEPVKSFDLGYDEQAGAIHDLRHITWKAPDGVDIQGYLLLPAGAGPHPLVLFVHGGPVSNWRPVWLGRPRGAPALLLLKHGYAVLFPNPRGSSGRGQEFARRVVGDMGGADTFDHLSALDHLVEAGIADPRRLGVTGGSYGGYMTAWLITQDSRFAAAAAVAPVTNQVTQHLTSNIPQFVQLFLADHYTNAAGKYFERSPIMHAHKVRTPTLSICGALDRCTPPHEAVQFHNALLERSVKSVLLTYPEEGHGVRKYPAAIDYAARLVSWFEEHMPSGRGAG